MTCFNRPAFKGKYSICGALRDLVSFAQFKKREKHPWTSVNFSTKIKIPPWVFFTFFKLYKWYQIAQRITYDLTSYVSKQHVTFGNLL